MAGSLPYVKPLLEHVIGKVWKVIWITMCKESVWGYNLTAKYLAPDQKLPVRPWLSPLERYISLIIMQIIENGHSHSSFKRSSYHIIYNNRRFRLFIE